MNRGAISVIYLALSAVCLVGLYGVYKPQVNAAAGGVFDRVERFTNIGFKTGKTPDQNICVGVTGLRPDNLPDKLKKSDPIDPVSVPKSVVQSLMDEYGAKLYNKHNNQKLEKLADASDNPKDSSTLVFPG